MSPGRRAPRDERAARGARHGRDPPGETHVREAQGRPDLGPGLGRPGKPERLFSDDSFVKEAVVVPLCVFVRSVVRVERGQVLVPQLFIRVDGPLLGEIEPRTLAAFSDPEVLVRSDGVLAVLERERLVPRVEERGLAQLEVRRIDRLVEPPALLLALVEAFERGRVQRVVLARRVVEQ